MPKQRGIEFRSDTNYAAFRVSQARMKNDRALDFKSFAAGRSQELLHRDILGTPQEELQWRSGRMFW
jgi:hypothetical protein